MRAVICPVCNGSGKIIVPSPRESSNTIDSEKSCHGCGGRGWVEVHEEPHIPSHVPVPNPYIVL